MRVSRYVLVLAAYAVVLGAGLGGEACSGDGDKTPPFQMAPPGDSFPDRVRIGQPCGGLVFVTGDVGYAFCDDGSWAYTTTNPGSDGYMRFDGHDARVDVSPGDDASADDAGMADGDAADDEDTGADASDDSATGDSGTHAGDSGP